LTACAARLRERSVQPFVFAVFAAEGQTDLDPDARYFVRPIRGIDPPRRGVYVCAEARVGARMTFGFPDPGASRANLQAASQRLHERARGADPRFALFIDCAGRGESLYGSGDVDVRVLRQRFGDLPIAGMHSAFEIAPTSAGRARVHFYTGVVAL